MEYLKTTEKIEIKDYPWGFKLKTSQFVNVEFSKTKGFRVVRQTIDPKNGRLCAPKKSTYAPVYVLTNNNGFIDSLGFGFNGRDEIEAGIKFVNENFDLFTPEQITYIYTFIHDSLLLDFRSICVYCGAKPETTKVYYLDALKALKTIVNSKEHVNILNTFSIDFDSIENCKDVNFQPFR